MVEKFTWNKLLIVFAFYLLESSPALGTGLGTHTAMDAMGSPTASSKLEAIIENTSTRGTIRVSHPRLFLSDTRLAELRAKACYDQNGNPIPGCTPTTDWVTFKNWVDNNSGYYLQGWHLALVYVITKDDAYSLLALEKTKSKITDGLYDERRDSYYYVASYIRNAALVYDWLNDFLTDSEKQLIIEYMNQLLTEIWNPYDNPYHTWSGWAINDPGNNYYYDFLVSTAYAAISTYYENPDPPILPFKDTSYSDILEFTYAKIDLQAVPDWLDTKAKGGGWHEGTNYRLTALMHMFELFAILKDADGINYFLTIEFLKEQLYMQLYLVQPGNRFEYPGGDLARESTMRVSNYDRQLMLFLADALQDRIEGKYAQFWLNHIDISLQYKFMSPFEFILYHPSLPGQDFRELPLAYHAEGLGWINSRSSWADDAISVSFISADRIQGHQHFDQNSFVIFKNGWQAVDVSSYSRSGCIQATDAHNTIIVDGWGQRFGQGTGSILKFESAEGYTYVVGDASDAYYGGSSGRKDRGDPPLLNTFIRELVHIIPHFVVIFDRVTPIDQSSKIKYLLQFHNEPTIQYNVVSSANDDGKLFQKSLLPENFDMIKVNEQSRWGTDDPIQSWRIELSSNSENADYQFLNVLFVTSSSTTSMPYSEHIASLSNNMTGAFIKDADKDIIIMFSSAPDGSVPSGDIIYEVGLDSDGRHLLFDLIPDAFYAINIIELDKKRIVRVSLGGDHKSSSQGVLSFNIDSPESGANDLPTISSSTH